MNILFMIHSDSFLGGPNTLMFFIEIVARHLVKCTDGHVRRWVGAWWMYFCWDIAEKIETFLDALDLFLEAPLLS